MNEKLRKIVIWVLLFSLILSLVPAVIMSAFAEGEEHQDVCEHESDDAWHADDNSHYHICSVCEEHYAAAAHEPVETWLDNSDGTTHYYACSQEGCPAKLNEHAYDLTKWVASGDVHYRVCTESDCSQHTIGEGHDFQKVLDDQYLVNSASPKSKGAIAESYKYYKSCSVCGAAGEETFLAFTVSYDFGDYRDSLLSEERDFSATCVIENETMTPPVPAFKGYRFDSWYYEEADANEPTKRNAVPFYPLPSEGEVSALSEDASLPVTKNLILKPRVTAQHKIQLNETNCTVAFVGDGFNENAVAVGDKVAFTVTASTGYAMSKVEYSDGSSAEPISLEAPYTFDMPDGDVTITAVARPEKPLNAISVSPSTLNLFLGGSGSTGSLSAAFTPDDFINQNVTWTADNTDIATVDEDGEVTAAAVGTTTVKATTVETNNENQHKESSSTVTVSKLSANADLKGFNRYEFNREILISLESGNGRTFADKSGNYADTQFRITSLPRGITATASRKPAEGTAAPQVVITLSGTPEEAFDGDLEIALQASVITGDGKDTNFYNVIPSSTLHLTIRETYAVSVEETACSVSLSATADGASFHDPEWLPADATITAEIVPTSSKYTLTTLNYTLGNRTTDIGYVSEDSAQAVSYSARFPMPNGNLELNAECTEIFVCELDDPAISATMKNIPNYLKEEQSFIYDEENKGLHPQLLLEMKRKATVKSNVSGTIPTGYKSFRYFTSELTLNLLPNDLEDQEGDPKIIHHLDEEYLITATVSIEGAPALRSGYYRTWMVSYRDLDGDVVEVDLSGSVSNNRITFTMPYFYDATRSTDENSDEAAIGYYAISYKDVYGNGNPTTGDNFHPGLAMLTMLLSLIGGAGVIHMNKHDEY